MLEYDRLFIGGDWVAPVGSDVLVVRSPASGDVVGRVPLASAGDVEAAVMAARNSVSLLLMTAALSGPIRISSFCPAGRDSSVGSANKYMTFGRTSSMGPAGCGVATKLSITCTSLSLK